MLKINHFRLKQAIRWILFAPLASLPLFCVSIQAAELNSVVNGDKAFGGRKDTAKMVEEPLSKRMKVVGGEVICDGSFRTLESNYTKIFDLVEVSTPVTPAANHIRLYVVTGTGSKQQLNVIFDDGTTAKIAGN